MLPPRFEFSEVKVKLNSHILGFTQATFYIILKIVFFGSLILQKIVMNLIIYVLVGNLRHLELNK